MANRTMEDFEMNRKILEIRYMVDFLVQGVRATPITKGVLGTYRCTQDIIERETNLLDNLEGIQKHLHEACDMSEKICYPYKEGV